MARAATGRDKVLVFDGKYHGHFDEALLELRAGNIVPEERGLPQDVTKRTKIVQFNDIPALIEALEPRDVAIVLTEPALTNVVGLLLPDFGFHEAVRAATRRTGTVLAYDEVHTQVVGPGGLTGAWRLHPDIVTLGKSIAAGVPLGAYGMTESIAAELEKPVAAFNGHPPVATGGTLFGNPVSMAAARAALDEILVEEAYAHTHKLGKLLADGIESAINDAGLSWTAQRLGPRSGVTFAPELPRNALEAYSATDLLVTHTMWAYFANRGVWESLVGAGPTCSIPATVSDVDRYVQAFRAFTEEVTS
jgi:glutamate-1-semialdehyde 2,1-aminomutase